MRIMIPAVGSRGDVQPFIALGRQLQEAGFEVTIGTQLTFQSFVHDHRLRFHDLGMDPRELLKSELGLRLVESSHNPITRVKLLMEIGRLAMPRWIAQLDAACREADAIIISPMASAAYSIAEARGIPALSASLQPLCPTRSFPSPVLRAADLGGFLNHWTHTLTQTLLWLPFRKLINEWRARDLGLQPLPFRGPFPSMVRARHPYLFAVSPSLVATPSDWPPSCHLTGYWFLPDDLSPDIPDGLEDFIASGPKPPIYVGFGSMTDRDPGRLASIVSQALSASGERAVVLSGWAELPANSFGDNAFVVESVSHPWLFSRVSAVVHHAGAGTTAAALHAGVPTIPVPFFSDQFFWSNQSRRIGVSLASLPRRGLRSEDLADAIRRTVASASIRKRAEEIGRRVRAERGTARAVELVSEHLRDAHAS